jgi:general secretion pathway protein H
MPTSISTKADGFTLVEVLVVIVVITFAAALVVVNLRGDDRAIARDEARRLAALLTQARDEAIATGSSLAWQAEGSGYRFLRRAPDRSWQPFPPEETFRARTLPAPMQFAAIEVSGQAIEARDALLFPSSGMVPPFRIVLAYNAERIGIRADTPARIVVEPFQ